MSAVENLLASWGGTKGTSGGGGSAGWRCSACAGEEGRAWLAARFLGHQLGLKPKERKKRVIFKADQNS